jgi:large subunit ribosomal protein L17
MRHLKAGNRLGVTTAHRRAIMRNMVTSILENGQITCTLARAKEVRKPLEKMIGWGKQGNLHARRQALRFVKSKEAMTQLFEELADRYKDRQGGYCRIIKLGKTRLGDNSEMAIIQLLGSKADQLSELKSQAGKKKKPKKKESSVLKEVSEEIKTESSSETKIETKKEKTQAENESAKGVPSAYTALSQQEPKS